MHHSHVSSTDSRRKRVLMHLGAALLFVSLAAACGSSDDSASTPASEDSPTDTPTADDTASTADDSAEAPADDATESDDETLTGSGPDGIYLVGDTFTDGDFLFVYEGLVKVPLDPLGAYSDGECFFAIGSATFIEGPSSQLSDFDSFTPAFNPIIAGTLDTEQNDEFFNCDAQAIGALGYSQTGTTDITLGETAPVWLDAIYLAPEQSGQLEGFELYGSADLVFEAEVTSDVSG